MKIQKIVAAVVVSLALMAAWVAFRPLSCSTLSAWIPTLDYDTWAAWALPGMVLVFLYYPAYDLLAFSSYRLGYEASFEDSRLYPDDSDDNTPPLTIGQKIFLVYPIALVVAGGIMAAWSRMVQCG
jgi:hypothetical protein